MKDFEDVFKEVLKRYISQWYDNVSQVTSYEQDERYYGICDTCRSEETVVVISYLTTDDEYRTYEYDGSFANLINALASIDASSSAD